MTWDSISKIAEDVRSARVGAVSNVEKALRLIKEKSEYQAIIASLDDRALSRAKQIDDAVKRGEDTGKLSGVPFIAKDNFLAFGAETTAASNILKGFRAPYQATVIEKLEAEGAICVAKANLDAFAHGSSTENSDFFTTLHPLDKNRVPGGSSGGSVASVMLDLAPFALGTDTGGSIRLPASFCGAVGYKPTYGLVSRYGVVAMASSTDVVGPIAKTVHDSALVLDVIAGRDPLDGTTISRDKKYEISRIDVKDLRIGVVREYMSDGVDPVVAKVINKAIDELRDQGAKIIDISLPSLPLALAVYYIICPAEVSSNLGRYDGQRFGHYSKKASDLDESYSLTRAEGFGDEAKRRILIGTYVLSSGYYDAYYKKAALVRTKLVNEFNDAFQEVDFLIGPTSPVTAFKVGERVNDPLQMYLIDIMTVASNLTGNPAISVPAGTAEKMPVGLQIIAPWGGDNRLLDIAATYNKEDWQC